MTKRNYLIFDFGASGGRAVIACYDDKKFIIDTVHRFGNHPVCATSTLHWDILMLYQELKNGISASIKKYKNVSALGIDAWGSDFGFIDKNGKLISNPVHYRDKRRAKDSKKLFKIISAKELCKLTGACIIPNFDIFHLHSLKIQNSPEIIYGNRFLPIADIFNYFITGNTFNESGV